MDHYFTYLRGFRFIFKPNSQESLARNPTPTRDLGPLLGVVELALAGRLSAGAARALALAAGADCDEMVKVL